MMISLWSMRVDGQKHWYGSKSEADVAFGDYRRAQGPEVVDPPLAETIPLNRPELVRWLNLQSSS
jgi:hypothetical protein